MNGGGSVQMVDDHVSGGAHAQQFATIADYLQQQFCDSRDCDSRKSPLHGGMDPQAIRDALKRKNMSQRELAQAIGMDENHLSKALLGKRRFSVEEMDSIRAVLRRSGDGDEERTGDHVRFVPLLGSVPAGSFREAVKNAKGHIPVPDASVPPNAYALDPDGDSMDLVVPANTRIIVDPDDLDLYPGRYYVVQNSAGETTFKRYEANPARLVPCSSNPEHKDIPIGREPFDVRGRVIGGFTRF